MEKTDFFSEMNCYISVDVETAGPNPSDYAMLSIGVHHHAPAPNLLL